MIPWVAAQLANPLIKWAVIVIGSLLLLSSYSWWIYNKGVAAKQQEMDASISRQAVETIEHMAALHESRDAVLRQHAAREQELQRKIDDLEHRKALYVKQPTKPCEVPPGSVAMFNAISGLHATDPERVPASDGASGSAHEPSEAEIGVTRLLLAYVHAYGDASEQLASLWVDYDGLVQEVRGRWIVETALRKARLEHE